MEKKDIDWSNIGFGYYQTDERYVSNFKNGAWDDGVMTKDANVVMNECAGVLQYAQTCFEGLKAYTTEHGKIVTFRPDLMLPVWQIRQSVWKCHHFRKIDL